MKNDHEKVLNLKKKKERKENIYKFKYKSELGY